MVEWMNEWCTYIALYCVLLYTQSTLQSWGGGLSSTTTNVQHPLGWCDGCHRTMAPVRSPHTSYRWRGERVREPIKGMGIIRRPWLKRASGGNLARTPLLFTRSAVGFLMTTESQDLSLLVDSTVSLLLCWGIRIHTDHKVSTPCWSH